MNQAKRYDIVMAVCMLPVLAVLVLSIYYFRIAYLHYMFTQDKASMVISLVGAVASLLIVPYTTMSVHEHGHKYLFYLAGAKSTISNKDTSYTLSYLHFLKQFLSLKGGFGWITNTVIPNFDKRLLKRDPMMYVLVCSAGVLANIITSTLLVLPLVIANIEIGWYSCSVSLFVFVYTFMTLLEYCTNIVDNKNENRDGFKARKALSNMDKNTLVASLRMKGSATALYIITNMLLSLFYLYAHPFRTLLALFLAALLLSHSIAIAVFNTLYITIPIFIILYWQAPRINDSFMIFNITNSFAMCPSVRWNTNFKNNRKAINDKLADNYIKGIVYYCDNPSWNKFLKRKVRIKTYQVTIDAIRKRCPGFAIDIGTPKYRINWNKVFFIEPRSVFNHLGYRHLDKKDAKYKFSLTHEEIMELRRMIVSEPS